MRNDHISRILGTDSEPGEVKAEAAAAPLITPELVDYLAKTFPVPTLSMMGERVGTGEEALIAIAVGSERDRILTHLRLLKDSQRRA